MKEPKLQIAATFTAEPIKGAIGLLLETLSVSTRIEFSPFNQVFQELLSPTSSLSNNQSGANVVLLRLEDLADISKDPEALIRHGRELAMAFRTAVDRFTVPMVLVFCPASSAVMVRKDHRHLLARIERELTEELQAIGRLHVITSDQFSQL